MSEITRPNYCTNDMLDYLDQLRESGATNIFGAGPYLEKEFKELRANRKSFHSGDKAREVLSYWMKTFSQRHNLENQQEKKDETDL